MSKASEDIKFLGLIVRPDEPDDELLGLFDWTCPTCTFRNRSSTVIRPQQAFLARWVCDTCGKMTLVRFRSRANAEWVAQHTVVISDVTLGPKGEPASPLQGPGKNPAQGRGQQRLLAFVAIPALAMIILLALSDLYPVRSCLAYFARRGAQSSHAAAPSSRLAGCWVAETGDHSLYFGRIDPVSKTGAYVPIRKDHTPCPWVRFAVVREDVNGAEVVIREIDERGSPMPHSDQVLHLPREGGSLIRVKLAEDHPVLTVYHPIGYKPMRQTNARPAP